MELMIYVVCMGDIRNAYSLWLASLAGSDNLEGLVISGMIILKYVLDKQLDNVGLIHLAQDMGPNMML
jgi:hypothetical protein